MTQAPRVAFYAPMKSPRHPNPSGDRKIARLFVKALEQAGAEVEIASELRARDGAGNIDDQTHIRECGASEANTLIKRYQEYPAAAPTHWFTYHLYHKAPDWIGPAVSKSLDIPYIVAEASFAPKQAGGPWRMGHEQVATALGSAAAVVVLNPIDLVCVTPLLREECVTMEQPIWMDIKPDPGDRDATRQKISQDFGLDPALPWLVAVAMMRPGDKTSSFECLSRALEHGTSTSWQLLVVGDGETRPRVQGMFSNFADRTAFVGARTEQDVGAILRACDVMVCPGVPDYWYRLATTVSSRAASVASSTTHRCASGSVLRHDNVQRPTTARTAQLKRWSNFCGTCRHDRTAVSGPHSSWPNAVERREKNPGTNRYRLV